MVQQERVKIKKDKKDHRKDKIESRRIHEILLLFKYRTVSVFEEKQERGALCREFIH